MALIYFKFGYYCSETTLKLPGDWSVTLNCCETETLAPDSFWLLKFYCPWRLISYCPSIYTIVVFYFEMDFLLYPDFDIFYEDSKILLGLWMLKDLFLATYTSESKSSWELLKFLWSFPWLPFCSWIGRRADFGYWFWYAFLLPYII